MAETIYRGPAISIGSLMGNVTTQAGTGVGLVEPFDGPGIEYQANTFPDVRFGPFNKDSLKVGRIPVFLNSPYVVMVDTIPSAVSTVGLAAQQAVTSNTPITLVTVAPGGSAAGVPSMVPAIPLNTISSSLNQQFPPVGAVQSVIALDFGFTTGNTNGTTTITVPDSTLFYQGQWIIVGGGGNVGKTANLITQVQSIPTATTIVVSTAPASTLNNSAIGSANFWGGALANPAFPPTGAAPYWSAGVAAVWNPLESLSRCVSITSTNAGSAANNVTVKGFDAYGMAMSEVIPFAGGATTKFGKKAFKYIGSITPATTDANGFSAGWGDTIGFAIRTDKWEYTNIFYNGGFAVSNVGWLAADKTNPATSSTGDVRGTVQVSANGNGAALAAPLAAATNGVIRVTLMMSVPLFNLINATPVSPTSMFGQTQA